MDKSPSVGLKFRRANKNDIPVILKWTSQEDYHHFINYRETKFTEDDVQRQLEIQLDQSISFSPSSFYYVVESDKIPVGMVFFHSLDWKNRNAVIEIYLGAADFRAKGYGKKIFLSACHIAFDELNLYKIYGYIYSFNEISVHISEYLTAKKEGVLRKALYKDEAFHDVYIYGLLKNEFILFLKKMKGS